MELVDNEINIDNHKYKLNMKIECIHKIYGAMVMAMRANMFHRKQQKGNIGHITKSRDILQRGSQPHSQKPQKNLAFVQFTTTDYQPDHTQRYQQALPIVPILNAFYYKIQHHICIMD